MLAFCYDLARRSQMIPRSPRFQSNHIQLFASPPSLSTFKARLLSWFKHNPAWLLDELQPVISSQQEPGVSARNSGKQVSRPSLSQIRVCSDCTSAASISSSSPKLHCSLSSHDNVLHFCKNVHAVCTLRSELPCGHPRTPPPAVNINCSRARHR